MIILAQKATIYLIGYWYIISTHGKDFIVSEEKLLGQSDAVLTNTNILKIYLILYTDVSVLC